jgi:hypothetical protein
MSGTREKAWGPVLELNLWGFLCSRSHREIEVKGLEAKAAPLEVPQASEHYLATKKMSFDEGWILLNVNARLSSREAILFRRQLPAPELGYNPSTSSSYFSKSDPNEEN